MGQIILHIEIDVNPTESEEKVRKAVWNLFGEIQLELAMAKEGCSLKADLQGEEPLSIFRNVLNRDHIRDASRKALYHGLKGRTLTIFLNKQAALAGHASFSEEEAESPLGPIKVTVESNDPQQLIDWLAPKTSKS